MKIKSIYLEDFINLIKEEYGEELELNEDTGKYWNRKVPLTINSWNYKVECKRNNNYDLNKLMQVFIKTSEHWYEEDPEGEKNE